MTKPIMILAISTIILVGDFIPLAEASVGWKGFLIDVGFGGSQVYEYWESVVIPQGEIRSGTLTIRCPNGDWLSQGASVGNSVDVSANPSVFAALRPDGFVSETITQSKVVGIEKEL